MLPTVLFLLLLNGVLGQNTVYYDTFRGLPITDEELSVRIEQNSTFWCTLAVEECDPNEGRRIDGSCNNLEHPSRGGPHTPYLRFATPPVFDKQSPVDYEPRKAKSGADLPLARRLRTSLLTDGRVSSLSYTQLVTHFWVFMAGDVSSIQDTINYVLWTPYCCTPEGRNDYVCTPNYVPNDDPVFRFSDIRCLNMTRPFSFQSTGCIANTTVPERIDSSTPLLDLSPVYGVNPNSSLASRTMSDGLLRYEIEDGRMWPPSGSSFCFLNQVPVETRCHNTPDPGANSLLGVNLMSVWFWRHHNFIATNLKQVNPSWDDDKLFYTARDINIAVALQIYYYELLPIFLGRENMLRDNVISASQSFRDLYNEKVIPQLSMENQYILRWVHTITEGILKMYDAQGYYVKQYPIVNLTLRTGYLAVDNNIDYLTQGSFRQAGANADYVVDPDLSNVGLGPSLRATDILTNDLAKNRYLGLPPYTKYREICSGRSHSTFEDLADSIDPEKLERLRELYEDVDDTELLAGVWVEKPIQGGYVPSTFYCLVVDQLIRNIVADRHWYERPNRPNAFTSEQLLEIRKASIARFLCNIGDTVTSIQPQAFFRTGPGNQIVSCDQITSIDFNAWNDSTIQPVIQFF